MDYLQKFYDRAFGWLLTFGPRILIGIIILIVGQWLIRFINRLVKNYLKRREFDPSLETFIQNLVAILMQVLLILMLMQILGIQMTIFAAVIAAFGVAAGLALSGTLQNFASGILILMLKPYRVGDNLITQGKEGTVTSIQLFYTVILTFDNTTVIVPNGKLSNEIIVNLSREGKRRLDIELKFKYNIDYNVMKDLLLKSVGEFTSCLKEPPPRIGLTLLDMDSYMISVNVWMEPHGFEDNRLALQEKILDDIRAAGIKLPGME
ncbi:MAG: mechanosensitive ion channel family protein [Gemmatimonadaceae bacterium]|nr:mechanosensitive ion channel family protein [Chitinophagaceae bacterium]